MDVRTWIEQYRLAWEQADADLAASLFTEDSHYRESIFDEPYTGQAGVRTYWTGVTAQQSDVDVQMGEPIIDGKRVMVEFWTRMTVDDDPVTLTGALILHFADDGRCEALREYVSFQPGRVAPPTGWGA